jgi:hypothetical protein
MKLTSKSGATLAVAAATLFLAGAATSTATYAAGEGHCIGANACKGQGFAEMTKSDCTAAKGKFEPA